MSEVKFNLDNSFKTNVKVEMDGVWFEVQPGMELLLKRYGGANTQTIKKIAAKHSAPFSRQLEKGTLAPEKDLEITAKTLVESCVLDWKGVEVNDVLADFTVELCVKMFIAYPELTSDVLKFAANSDNFKGDVGNS